MVQISGMLILLGQGGGWGTKIRDFIFWGC